jgi:hypothetical protein
MRKKYLIIAGVGLLIPYLVLVLFLNKNSFDLDLSVETMEFL